MTNLHFYSWYIYNYILEDFSEPRDTSRFKYSLYDLELERVINSDNSDAAQASLECDPAGHCAQWWKESIQSQSEKNKHKKWATIPNMAALLSFKNDLNCKPYQQPRLSVCPSNQYRKTTIVSCLRGHSRYEWMTKNVSLYIYTRAVHVDSLKKIQRL